jgi:tetratricopeptide (TPR) repeat protein
MLKAPLGDDAPVITHYFTDRTDQKERFRQALNAREGEHVPVIAWYGVGGAGKSSLVRKLRELLRTEHPDVPHALWDFNSGFDPEKVLTGLRNELAAWSQRLPGDDFTFPRFDLAQAVLAEKMGEAPLQGGTGTVGGAMEALGELIPIPILNILVGRLAAQGGEKLVNHVPRLRKWLEGAGGREVAKWRLMAPQELSDRLVWAFASDLAELLDEHKVRPGCARRAVVFLDAYERLFAGMEGGDAVQAQYRDVWVQKELVPHLWAAGVQVVIAGRDRLRWEARGFDSADLEQHLLGGISNGDADAYLTELGIEAGELRDAILDASRESAEGVHAFHYGLCIDIWRENEGRIEPERFRELASAGDKDHKLTLRFLVSLPAEGGWQSLVRGLSLPRWFDRESLCAVQGGLKLSQDLASDEAWRRLCGFSFVEEAEGVPGRYRMHSVMRGVLRGEIEAKERELALALGALEECHTGRAVEPGDVHAAEAWYMRFSRDPRSAAWEWWGKVGRLAERPETVAVARAMLTWWDGIDLEGEAPDDEARAYCLVLLANRLWDVPQRDIRGPLQRAIECYQAALRIYTEETAPQEWATTQNNLGNAYSDLPTGDQGENLRRAIERYEAALRVYTEEAAPRQWAMTQNNLGNAYRDLPTGDQGENLQRAIEHYKAALRVRTEEAAPGDWAMTQNNLGNAYSDLPTGDRGENLGQAIRCFEAALRVYTEEAAPQQWATVQNGLGVAYSDLPTGDRGENLRRAIEHYEAALRVYTEEAAPHQWAGTQNGLGLAYSDLPTGDRGENLRRAMECYEAALRVYTEEAAPQWWAGIQNNLGLAYSDLPTGDRGENLRRAMECYEAALRVYTEKAAPHEWARTQNNLGNAYQKLPTGDRGENLRQAIRCFEAALRVCTEEAAPRDRVRTLGNAALALAEADDSRERLRAIPFAVEATRLDPDDPDTWDTLAYCYFKVERWSDAVESWDRALALDPEWFTEHEYAQWRYDEAARRAAQA